MTAAQTTMTQTTTAKSFGIGLAVAAAVYALAFGYAWIKRAETMAGLETQLASTIVPIDREKAAIPLGPPAPPNIQTLTDGQKTAAALPKAPIHGLTEETQDGTLPAVRNSDNLTPFDAYRRPFTLPKAGTPTISLGISDYGLSDSNSKQSLNMLPPNVSMVMTPYTKAPSYWLNEARNNGHEVWLSLPVETDSYPRNDTGPETLTLGGLEQMNMRKLHWTMSLAQGYVGLVTPHQEAFLKSAEDAMPIIDDIFKRGVGLIDGNAISPSSLSGEANKRNAAFTNVDLWLNPSAPGGGLADELKQLEDFAKNHGSAVGIIPATPDDLKTLQTWITTLPSKGIALAPLSGRALQTK